MAEKNIVHLLACNNIIDGSMDFYEFKDKETRKKYSLDDMFFMKNMLKTCTYVDMIKNSDGNNTVLTMTNYRGYMELSKDLNI